MAKTGSGVGTEVMTESMKVHRTFRFHLHCTAEQESNFRRFAGVTRLVYNLALEQRSNHWRAFQRHHGKPISMFSQIRELTDLRREWDFIRAVPQSCQEKALRDLNGAFADFFARRSGFPSPRRKGLNDSFRFRGREIVIEPLNRRWAQIRLPKIGWVRFLRTRKIQGQVHSVTVRRDTLGWHVSLACAVEMPVRQSLKPQLGLDRGVARSLAMSDGSFADMPIETIRMLDRRARKQARALARCKRASNRRVKARARLAATKARAARVRKHFNHVQSYRIASKFGVVVIENLQTNELTRSAKGTVDKPGKGISAKAGLNKAILNQGWHRFETFLAYKLEANGGQLIKVPAAYTSQTCSACDSISKHHRKSQAVFQCSDCGHSANADTNAAINILRAGTRPADANDEVAHVVRESREAA